MRNIFLFLEKSKHLFDWMRFIQNCLQSKLTTALMRPVLVKQMYLLADCEKILILTCPNRSKIASLPWHSSLTSSTEISKFWLLTVLKTALSIFEFGWTDEITRPISAPGYVAIDYRFRDWYIYLSHDRLIDIER